MSRELLMLSRMGMGLAISASHSVEFDHEAPSKKPRARPLDEPMRVRKEKSDSLKRLLRRKGRI